MCCKKVRSKHKNNDIQLRQTFTANDEWPSSYGHESIFHDIVNEVR